MRCTVDPGWKPGWMLPKTPWDPAPGVTRSYWSLSAALRRRSHRTPTESVDWVGSTASWLFSTAFSWPATAATWGGKPASGIPGSEVFESPFSFAYVAYGVNLFQRCPALTYHAAFLPMMEWVSNCAHSAMANQGPGS